MNGYFGLYRLSIFWPINFAIFFGLSVSFIYFEFHNDGKYSKEHIADGYKLL